jgi:hypothetical protein
MPFKTDAFKTPLFDLEHRAKRFRQAFRFKRSTNSGRAFKRCLRPLRSARSRFGFWQIGARRSSVILKLERLKQTNAPENH